MGTRQATAVLFKHLASGAMVGASRRLHTPDFSGNWPESIIYCTGPRRACAYVSDRCIDRIEYGEFEFEVGLTARVIRVKILTDLLFSFSKASWLKIS